MNYTGRQILKLFLTTTISLSITMAIVGFLEYVKILQLSEEFLYGVVLVFVIFAICTYIFIEKEIVK